MSGISSQPVGKTMNAFEVMNAALVISGIILFLSSSVFASDWDEETPAEKNKRQQELPRQEQKQEDSPSEPARPDSKNTAESVETTEFAPVDKKSGSAGYQPASDSSPDNKPLEGKIEKTHDGSVRIKRQINSEGGDLKSLPLPETEKLDAKAVDDELRGMLKDGSLPGTLKGLDPILETQRPLQGKAELKGGKAGKALDPDEDDAELLVEWDRWHNRFLRAVQLGTQENVNNPDPDEYEKPRIDPRTGMISTRYPLGTGAAFSCIVTEDGQIKNLEIFETSGFPKYDRAVLRAVQQLAGTHILRFPKGSHRKTVMQPGRIKTASQAEFKYHHFGDVERIRN